MCPRERILRTPSRMKRKGRGAGVGRQAGRFLGSGRIACTIPVQKEQAYALWFVLDVPTKRDASEAGPVARASRMTIRNKGCGGSLSSWPDMTRRRPDGGPVCCAMASIGPRRFAPSPRRCSNATRRWTVRLLAEAERIACGITEHLEVMVWAWRTSPKYCSKGRTPDGRPSLCAR